MRNLTFYRQHRRCFQFIENLAKDRLSEVRCVVNPNNDDLYVLLDNCIYKLTAEKNDCLSTLEKLAVKIVGLEYCILTEELYCAYEDGYIARINVSNGKLVEYEVITNLEDGLQCIKLSPDNETIVALTGTKTLITLTLDFIVISKINWDADAVHKSNCYVNIGWGKKETQFHGSEGKAAAQAVPEQIIPNEADNGLPQITWRADSSLFAVSVFTESRNRQFQIYNREGTLLYISEATNGLEEYLAWKSDILIAATRRLANKYQVVFFQKNGLIHKKFDLPFEPTEVTVQDLSWSPGSDILTIVCKQRSTSNTIVQLWTERNCHWYLKQTIIFPADKPLIFATWSSTKRGHEKTLILLASNEIMFCSYNWCVNQSRNKTINDNAVVSVIDGKKILITALRKSIVPPPMADQYLLTEEPINAITFAPSIENTSTKSWMNNSFCTVSCGNNVTFYKQAEASSVQNESCHSNYEVFKSCNISSDMSKISECNTYTMHHFLWFAENIFLCSLTGDNHFLFCQLSLNINSERDHFTIRSTHTIDAPIEHIIPSPDADVAYVVAKESVFKYTKGELLPTDINLKDLCYQVEVVKINARHVILALCSSNCFLIDGKEVARNITSFYVHSTFLLLTTLQHSLICVPLNENGLEQLSKHDLTAKLWKNDGMLLKGIYVRRIERGSQIITAISCDSKVILQITRGNLECIHLRPMLLYMIGSYILNCNYRVAFNIMRKQRINLNFIYDYNPSLFLNNADKFIEDIASPTCLSLFLSELENRDVIETMYSNCYLSVFNAVETENKKQMTENKVSLICKILKSIMEERDDADNLIQPILTCMVKNQQTTGLELALEKIKQMQAAESSQKTASRFTISSEEAFKYLLYLVNINVLYDTALSMYDFELTMFVASKSQKDPKEYIPFLNNLRALEENHMKYSIDMHLKRYESALQHASKTPSLFEECLNLIRQQKLYSKAIKLFVKGSAEYKKVTKVFGEYLLIEKKYQEAAVMFDKSEDFKSALNAYMLADNWQDGIIAVKKLNLSPTDSRELYTKIMQRLKTDRKYKEAAEILKYYLNDVEEAVALFCKGRCWQQAIRLTYDVQRLDLHETHIIPEIKEQAEYTLSQIRKVMQNFIQHKSRLATVREKMQCDKQKRLVINEHSETREVMGKYKDVIHDTYSEVDSVSSIKSQISSTSGRSYRSMKNRRKQERKLFNWKEGNVFEDISLIYSLYQIISDAYKNRDEWSELVRALVYLGFDDLAEEIQSTVSSFFKLIQDNKAQIWNNASPTSLHDLKEIWRSKQNHQDAVAFLDISLEPCLMYPPLESNVIPSVFRT